MKMLNKIFSICRMDCVAVALFLLCSGTIPSALGAANGREVTYLHFNGINPIEVEDQVRIYTHNTCSMPGVLPGLYGGLDPARYRVEAIAKLIKECDPDIVCLQEVSDGTGLRLKDKLSDRYAHFYLNIGSPALFLGSGLFVATKYNVIKEPEFYPFDIEGMQKGIVRGYLILEMDKCIIINTHLQPGHTEKDQRIRKEELDEIIKKMNQIQTDKPIMLCGDLNIERTGLEKDEYSQSQIQDNFYDPYYFADEEISIDTETQSDFFKEHHPRVLDYILIPKMQGGLVDAIKRIDVYSYESENNISDHHALMAIID